MAVLYTLKDRDFILSFLQNFLRLVAYFYGIGFFQGVVNACDESENSHKEDQDEQKCDSSGFTHMPLIVQRKFLLRNG